MGYLFLSLALASGTAKGYCGKRIGGFTKGLGSAVLANGIRMILCIIIGFAIIVLSGETKSIVPSAEALFISALSGVSTAVFVVTWLLAVRKSAYMMLDIFLMLGVLIPLISSGILLGEAVKPVQWVGIGILFIAVALMCSYNNSIKKRLTLSSLLLLLGCGAANGIADLSQKLFVKQVEGGSIAVFNFYTYVFAAVVLFVFLSFSHGEKTSEKTDFRQIFGYIFIMACCLFANSYFKTLAAGRLSAVLLYPLNQGCSLILSSIMAAVLFRERLTAKAVVGMAAAFVAMIFINLL